MAKPERPPIVEAQVRWLIATGIAAVVPLSPHVPLWLTIAAGAMLMWRVWLARHRRPLPGRWLLLVAVIAGCAGVVAQFLTLFGQNPGIALLILFLALKQLETRTTRDGLAIVFLAYFLAMAQFFYSQTIPAAFATAIVVLIATATLMSLADSRSPPLAQLRRSGAMLLQAAPLMMLLFVLFPRVQGPLWGLPKDAHTGLTGLSDTMAPGAISSLSQSKAIAFRVRFNGPVPDRQKLYWRGPVLSEFDGRTWRPAREKLMRSLPYSTPTSGGVDHEVTVEPHGKPWLLALEMPGSVPSDALVTRDFQLVAASPIVARQRYAITSFPDIRVGLDDPLRQQALSLPKDANPRISALAASWREKAADDEDVLREAQSFFLRQGLIYTLAPRLLGEHSADEFLFDTKQGFCEHFASAFAIAMRAAGLPARVVTGYQGGEVNPVDGWLTVHQYDAHAWTEVWLPNRGWVRLDPTAISAPTRIDLNLAAAVPFGDPLPLMMRADLSWLRDLRFHWDAVTNAWNQWVLGYNPERQLQFLQRLGMPQPDWRSMTAALALLCGVALLGLTAWTLRRRRQRDPEVVVWDRLSRRLARRGLARQQSEGPLDYAERVAAELPSMANEIRAIAADYAGLRYAEGAPDRRNSLDRLRRRVASFRP
jgi:transglutaminase-like putative cysteine protease